ncbi:hypothetical protein THAOC_07634 [Thalassiosira oceanica]|uniref:HSF-type DNA-binding domain-containing protein n=1 Tax=Thalassiosira oceanica TaxID=159749 RepID=K0SX17_THAOC|nr:hypothetical protein THAOC_07634 [Thalassiosira oceanica]|eukprot:EJK70968.1 hypothetical protein THAOC_07634 [Thalassiosira oceanica]
MYNAMLCASGCPNKLLRSSHRLALAMWRQSFSTGTALRSASAGHFDLAAVGVVAGCWSAGQHHTTALQLGLAFVSVLHQETFDTLGGSSASLSFAVNHQLLRREKMEKMADDPQRVMRSRDHHSAPAPAELRADRDHVLSHGNVEGAERRGSEYLLMAAEAYAEAERTSDHAPTVFQAAFDIATAGSAGPPPAPAKSPAAKAKTPRKTTSRHRSTKVRPPPVKHEYHDWSTFAGYDNVILSDRKHKAGGVTQPFPDKLMTMLDAESVARPEVISWCSHGRAFICKQPKVFTDEIMGNYFKQSKLTSFQRQLNLYGFRRITRGPDASAYYHELFLRGRPVLCMRMVRQKIKGTGHKQPIDHSTEPDFYAMAPIKPRPTVTAVARAQYALPPIHYPTSQPYHGEPGVQSEALNANLRAQAPSLAAPVPPVYASPGVNASELLLGLARAPPSAPPALNLGEPAPAEGNTPGLKSYQV